MNTKKKKIITIFITIALCLSYQADIPFVLEFRDETVRIYRPLTKEERKRFVAAKTKRYLFLIQVGTVLITFSLIVFILVLFKYLSSFLTEQFLLEKMLLPIQNPLLTCLIPLLASTVKVKDERIDFYEHDGKVHLTFLKESSITFDKNSDEALMALIFLSKMKMVPVKRRTNKLSNKIIGDCTGFTGTWVSKLNKRFDKYGLKGLDRLPHGGLLSKEAEKQLITYLSQDFSLSQSKFSKLLVQDGYNEATPAAVKNVLSNINLNYLLPAFRAQKKGKVAQGEPSFLIENLLSLVDTLLPYINDNDCIKVPLEELKNQCQQYIKTSSSRSYSKNKKIERVEGNKIRNEKQYCLTDCLNGHGVIIRCTHCGSTNYHIKERRNRKCCQTEDGTIVVRKAIRHKCLDCNRTFTISPTENVAYIRSDRELIAITLTELFDAKSLRRIQRKGITKGASAHSSTLLRWVKQVADTMPNWYEVYVPRTSGTIAIDEKWVKVLRTWYYIFIAVDTESLDILHIDIFPTRDEASATTFLSAMKTIGFDFDTIITDGCLCYNNSIPKVFPNAKHIRCILHMGRSMRNRLMKVFGSYKNEDYEVLAPYIRRIYKARTAKTFDKAWDECIKIASNYPEVKDFIEKIEKEKEDIKKRVIDKNCPRTTNSVERVIREFQRKYLQMETFNSFYYARAWCQLFQVYFRLTKFGRGRFSGKSPAEVMNYDVEGLEWTDFVLPSEEILTKRKFSGHSEKKVC